MMRLGVALIFWLAVVGAAAALEARMADGGAVTWTVRTDGPALQAKIIVRNASGVPRRLLTAAELIGRKVDANVPAEWTLAGPLAEGGILPAGTEASYTLSATLSRPGIYETAITGHTPETDGINGEVWRIAIEVQRAVAPIAAPAVTLTTSPIRVTLGPMGGMYTGVTTISLRNAGNEPIEFVAPTVFSTAAVEAETEWSPQSAGQPSIDAGNCRSPLAPGAACAFEFDPGTFQWPGEYHIGVGLEGSGGGWVETTQLVTARWHWSWAFITVLIGVVAGWLFQAWRRVRPAAEALLVLASAAERLRTLATIVSDPEFVERIESLTAEVEDAEHRIRTSGATSGDVERVVAWVRKLVEVSGLWRAFHSMSDEARTFLSKRWEAVIATIGPPWDALPDPDFTGKLQRLGQSMKTWPEIAIERARVTRLEAALRSLATLDADGTASAKLAKEMRIKVDGITDGGPLPASVDDVLGLPGKIRKGVDDLELDAQEIVGSSKQRLIDNVAELGTAAASQALGTKVKEWTQSTGVVDDLQALAGMWREYHEVAEAVTAGSGMVMANRLDTITPIVVPGMPRIELPPRILLPVPGGSKEKVESLIRRNDLIMTTAVALAAGLVGVATLWATDPTWGGIASLITAFMGGAASRIVVGDAG